MNRSAPDWLIASGLVNILLHAYRHVVPCNVILCCKVHVKRIGQLFEAAWLVGKRGYSPIRPGM